MSEAPLESASASAAPFEATSIGHQAASTPRKSANISFIAASLAFVSAAVLGFQQYSANRELTAQIATEKAAQVALSGEKTRLEAALKEATATMERAADEKKLEAAEHEKARAELQHSLDEAEGRAVAESKAKNDALHQAELARAETAEARRASTVALAQLETVAKTVDEVKAAADRKAAAEAQAAAEQKQAAEAAAADKRTAELKAEPAQYQTVTPAQAEQDRAAQMQGLWETITAGLRKVDHPPLMEMKVLLTGAKAPMEIQYFLQPQPRPLVIIVNGTFSKAQNLYAEMLESTYIRAGYNVVTFDSFFSRRFLLETQYGAPGNFKAEAEIAGRIVSMFLKQPGISDKVSDIGVVGLSYGGAVALQMALLDQSKQLPFKLARVQVYSIPVSFQNAFRILDEFEAQPYSYDTIIPIVLKANKRHQAMPDDTTVEMLQKVIGRSFRLDLPETVESVDRIYFNTIKKNRASALETNYLGDGQAAIMDRESEASSVSFRAFFASWLAPYWHGTSRVSAEDLLAMGELSQLLPQLSDKVQIVIAQNDPLNVPGSIDALSKIKTGAKLILQKSGGHLGFLETDAIAQIAAGMFGATLPVENKKKK